MRRTARIAAYVLVVVVGLTLLGVVGAGWGIDAYAGSAIEDRGLRCDPVDVAFAMDLSRVTVGPTRCRPSEPGPLNLLRVTGGAVAELDAERRPTGVEVQGLELDLDEDRGGDSVSTLIRDGVVPPRLRRALDGLAELSQRDDVPALSVGRLLLIRGTDFVTLRRVELVREDGGVTVTVEALHPPPVGSGRWRVAGRMDGLRLRATPSEASLRGTLHVEATLGQREIDESVPFALRGARLDTEAPEYAAEIELSENLQAMRERQRERQAQREREANEPPGPPLNEQIHALAVQLQAQVDSMQAD